MWRDVSILREGESEDPWRTCAGRRWIVRRRGLRPNAGEERLDARSASNAFVLAELDFRRDAKAERSPHPRAQISGGAGKPVERCGPFGVGAHDADEDARVTEVGSDVDTRDRDEAHDTRIL